MLLFVFLCFDVTLLFRVRFVPAKTFQPSKFLLQDARRNIISIYVLYINSLVSHIYIQGVCLWMYIHEMFWQKDFFCRIGQNKQFRNYMFNTARIALYVICFNDCMLCDESLISNMLWGEETDYLAKEVSFDKW